LIYPAQEGFVNLDSARQSQIEALRPERGAHSPGGKGDEEDRFGKVAASPNSQNLTERGINASPVDCFDRGIDSFRSTVRKRLPFTFIAYRSLVPDKDDDWYYLAQKVAWFVFILFNVVNLTFSPIFILVPFVPMILDAIWTGCRIFSPSKDLSSDWLKPIEIIGFVAFSALGVALLFQKLQP
jgi:hypothetical protein